MRMKVIACRVMIDEMRSFLPADVEAEVGSPLADLVDRYRALLGKRPANRTCAVGQ